MNVATYGPKSRFAMTDRGRDALALDADRLQIGPSSMRWGDGRLVIGVDELAGPPKVGRVRGRIVLTPAAITGVELPLTPDGRHVWRPFAPTSRIEVALEAPGLSWEGHGYFDGNFGTAAIEADFSRWSWGRFPTDDGTVCFYDARRRDGTELGSAHYFRADGTATALPLPPVARLPRTFWALPRVTRADTGHTPRQVMAMVDAPFYSRSLVRTRLDGVDRTGVHEMLDLDRFRWVLLKPMIAVRVPRRRRWAA